MRRAPRRLPPLLLLALAAGTGRALPIETTVRVAVKIPAETGPLPGLVPTLVVREDDRTRHPLLLIVHGRGIDAAENRRFGRVDYPSAARHYAARGYAVLIPTRIGYGYAAGPDLEESGPCAHKDARQALQRAAAEMDQVLETVARQPWADPGRVVVIGDSFGGLVALRMATSPRTGLRGVVAFSAGDGGDSLHHVDAPCDASGQASLWADLGAGNRLPTLVVYSQNDRLFGPDWPRRWFDRFTASGGRGEWALLPADKNNGHYVFTRNAAAWQPAVDGFLQRLGLP